MDNSYLVPAWIISDDKGLMHIAKVYRFPHLQDEAGRKKRKFVIKICILKLFSHFAWIMWLCQMHKGFTNTLKFVLGSNKVLDVGISWGKYYK